MTERILLVLPLVAYNIDGRVYTDSQACRALALWLSNFESVTLACPTEQRVVVPAETDPVDRVSGSDRLVFVPLPRVYTPHRVAAALPRVWKLLANHIRTAHYLHFAIGGLWGDWAAVACIIAHRNHLPFAVWTDRVESRVVAFNSQFTHGARRLYRACTAYAMSHYERFLIRRAELGLFHGNDCYSAYAPYCRNPHIVYNVLLGRTDSVSEDQLSERFSKSPSGSPLQIVYAGRAHEEKGIFDWLDVMTRLAKMGVAFRGTWYGDGPALERARAHAVKSCLGNLVAFPGHISRESLLPRLRKADVFVFCHKTPESPRCLIEALISGLPIVGYDQPYPRDLIKANQGGFLLSPDQPQAVADGIAKLKSNRSWVQELSHRAAADGRLFVDELVFRHRSELMKSIPARA